MVELPCTKSPYVGKKCAVIRFATTSGAADMQDNHVTGRRGSMTGKITLVLNAMGVIYRAADDVTELLVPFVREKGGLSDSYAIATLYTQASLGKLSADKFWDTIR
ncbi:MAG TPA: hypothetical protein GX509_00315 [Firmicutes bacterium]|nr:hypothetical protein [Bacillota bacterium]